MSYKLETCKAHRVTLYQSGYIVGHAFERSPGTWVSCLYTAEEFGKRLGVADSKTDAALMLICAELDRTTEWRNRR